MYERSRTTYCWEIDGNNVPFTAVKKGMYLLETLWCVDAGHLHAMIQPSDSHAPFDTQIKVACFVY